MNFITKHGIIGTAAITSLFLSACVTTQQSETVEVRDTPISEQKFKKENTDGTATLTLTVTDIVTAEGFLSAALFDESGYSAGGSTRGKRVEVSGDKVVVSFNDLPIGEYGIKMFHDIDGDGDMNTNLFGIPSEPFAFSNNARGTMGPAKWEQAKFTVSSGENSHTISLKP